LFDFPQILPLSAFSAPAINQQEYILGLIDFTGEVGRFAVACATG
jgi:predicted translin family RNA/ssDNA-binding protein